MPDLPARYLGILYATGITFPGWHEMPEGSVKVSSGRFLTPYRETWAKWELWIGPAGLIFRVRHIHKDKEGLKETIWLTPGFRYSPGRPPRRGKAPPWVRGADRY